MLKHVLAAIVAVVAICLLGVEQAHAAANASLESSAPQASDFLDDERLAMALRTGGYVIYFRHTATDFSKSDSQMRTYGDCTNQRLLSDVGRQDARDIGLRIRALRPAQGEVLASPLCRTMEHARLVFARTEPTPALREAEGGDYPGLKALLARPVEAGRNRWLFGHGNPFRAVAGPPHLAEGEAVVVQPTGASWRVVAHIPVEGWAALTGPP